MTAFKRVPPAALACTVHQQIQHTHTAPCWSKQLKYVHSAAYWQPVREAKTDNSSITHLLGTMTVSTSSQLTSKQLVGFRQQWPKCENTLGLGTIRKTKPWLVRECRNL